MHSTDYASRPARASPCTHPRERVRKVDDHMWRCDGCGELRGYIDMGKWFDMIMPNGHDGSNPKRWKRVKGKGLIYA